MIWHHSTKLCNIVFETIDRVVDHLMFRRFISNQIYTHQKIDPARSASYAENVFTSKRCFRGMNDATGKCPNFIVISHNYP